MALANNDFHNDLERQQAAAQVMASPPPGVDPATWSRIVSTAAKTAPNAASLYAQANQAAQQVPRDNSDAKNWLYADASAAGATAGAASAASRALSMVEDHFFVSEIGGTSVNLARDVATRNAVLGTYKSAERIYGKTNMTHFTVSMARVMAKKPGEIGQAFEKTVQADLDGNPALKKEIVENVNSNKPDMPRATADMYYKGERTAADWHQKLAAEPGWNEHVQQLTATAKTQNPNDHWHSNPNAIEYEEFQKRNAGAQKESPKLQNDVETLDRIAHNRPLRTYKHDGGIPAGMTSDNPEPTAFAGKRRDEEHHASGSHHKPKHAMHHHTKTPTQHASLIGGPGFKMDT
jgi:hypothetical protein